MDKCLRKNNNIEYDDIYGVSIKTNGIKPTEIKSGKCHSYRKMYINS